MKICFLSTMAGIPWGGSEELWTDAALLARRLGHDVMASVYDWPTRPARLGELADAGVTIHFRPLQASRFQRLVLRRDAHVDGLSDLAKRPYDLLCISQGGTFDLPHATPSEVFDKLTRGHTVPYGVVCQFGTDEEVLSPAAIERARDFFGRAGFIGFVSEHNRAAAVRHIAQDLPRALVLRNPVNLKDKSPVPWPSGGKTVICNVARLDARVKGQDALIDALSTNTWRSRDWELQICGQGADLDYLKMLAEQRQITDRVRFMGQVSDIRQLWSQAHLLVMPSRAEGTPLAMVEAMLCGRPAVVTDVGGNAEWIREGETGFVAPSPAPQYISAALDRAWAARNQWQAMGARAHAFAAEQTKENPAKVLLDLLLKEAPQLR